ncbi:hypothetical protein AHMF7605_04000 [Adhaeribacter arboris]|uniref:Uncharacterized protein n=1 Tax=Adhaeribacter arboris TaxID=2072846 RepID=A0A2T2YB51_9BACT|nr:hypothetical protein [Adhaeribacter arboris]PSR52742.1 hypothetical protein AHMF7605_04000 [Adhaeribacter arboris]
MKKFKFSLPNLFLLYLGAVMSFFIYAGVTGTRMLGDDTEKFDPNGPGSRENTRVRSSRFYHK